MPALRHWSPSYRRQQLNRRAMIAERAAGFATILILAFAVTAAVLITYVNQ
jgi:hypothetical protein